MATYEDSIGIENTVSYNYPMKAVDPPAMQQIAELRESLERLTAEFKRVTEEHAAMLRRLDERLG